MFKNVFAVGAVENKTNNTNEELRLVYVILVGNDLNGGNIYKLLFGYDPDNVFGEGWGEKPACNQSRQELMIDESMYDYTGMIETEIDLDLAQDNCCFTMQDCKDGIIAIASENLDSAEEYPEEGRVVLHFGDTLEYVEDMLSTRGIRMRMVK